MLVGIDGNLIDFKALGGIFVVQLAQCQVVAGRLSVLVGGEVYEHNFAFQVGQMAGLAFDVHQGNIDKGGLSDDFAGERHFFHLRGAGVFHALDDHIVQVARAVGVRIEIVHAGGHGGKAFYVVLVVQRVEDHVAVQLLEQGEIGIRLVRPHKDIVPLHLVLIAVDEVHQAVLGQSGRQSRTAHLVHLGLQVGQQEGQFLNFLVVFILSDLVVGRELVIVGIDTYGLGRVDCEMNGFVVHAQAVVFGRFRLGRIEPEITAAFQSGRVEGDDAAQPGMFDV